MHHFSNFKRRVLDRSINEINNNTHLDISYKIYKLGSKVDKIEFIYLNKIIKNKNSSILPGIQEQIHDTRTITDYTSFGEQILNSYRHYLPNWSPVISWNSLFLTDLLIFFKEEPKSKNIEFWDQYFILVGQDSFKNGSEFKNKNFPFLFQIKSYYKIINSGISDIKVLSEREYMKIKEEEAIKISSFVIENMNEIFIIKSKEFKIHIMITNTQSAMICWISSKKLKKGLEKLPKRTLLSLQILA
jgi:hypothetical protein